MNQPEPTFFARFTQLFCKALDYRYSNNSLKSRLCTTSCDAIENKVHILAKNPICDTHKIIEENALLVVC